MDDNLQNISDGKLYEWNDMVKVGCHDCAGCSECCRDMGQSILLDPYDVYQLTKNLGQSFTELLAGPVELHMEDGLILPNLKMTAVTQEACAHTTNPVHAPAVGLQADVHITNPVHAPAVGMHAAAHTTNPVHMATVTQQTDAHQLPSCAFLNEQGRCSIHAFRPGICRLFPLGRNYTPDHLNYFLLVHECPAKNKTKMKVGKWLDCDRLRDYQQFLIDWHNLTKQVRAQVAEHLDDAEESRRITMQFLNLFFVTPYTGEDFYTQFYARLKEA